LLLILVLIAFEFVLDQTYQYETHTLVKKSAHDSFLFELEVGVELHLIVQDCFEFLLVKVALFAFGRDDVCKQMDKCQDLVDWVVANVFQAVVLGHAQNLLVGVSCKLEKLTTVEKRGNFKQVADFRQDALVRT
jgi:hypothetical protein